MTKRGFEVVEDKRPSQDHGSWHWADQTIGTRHALVNPLAKTRLSALASTVLPRSEQPCWRGKTQWARESVGFSRTLPPPPGTRKPPPHQVAGGFHSVSSKQHVPAQCTRRLAASDAPIPGTGHASGLSTSLIKARPQPQGPGTTSRQTRSSSTSQPLKPTADPAQKALYPVLEATTAHKP